MSTNKILLALVIILAAILISLFIWQGWGRQPSYYAVYLQSGDLYFGRLVRFPYFGLKQVYVLQLNPQNQESPFSIQRFPNTIWGPKDYLKINRDQVVWLTELDPNGQFAQLIRSNPNLAPPAATSSAP